MDRKELEKLERERAKLEAAREKLEAERERMEDERQEMEDARQELEDARQELEDARESLEDEKENLAEEEREKVNETMDRNEEILREKAEKLTEAQREKLEKMAEKIEKAMEGVQEEIENRIAGIDLGRIDRDIENGMSDMKKSLKQMDRELNFSFDSSMKNVGILNLKDITAEELDRMGEIRNSGVIIVPEELMGRLTSKVTKNMGEIIPYKKGWRIYSGQTDIDRSMLDALEEPIEFIHFGQLSIGKDVTADMVKAKVKAFHNYGHVSATEETYGILMARCLENYGQISKNGGEGNDSDPPEPPAVPKPPRHEH
jgi:hypothetical protein